MSSNKLLQLLANYYLARNWIKNQKFQTNFSQHCDMWKKFKCHLNNDWKGLNIIYHSTLSYGFLCLLIFCRKKTNTPESKTSPHFQWWEKQVSVYRDEMAEFDLFKLVLKLSLDATYFSMSLALLFCQRHCLIFISFQVKSFRIRRKKGLKIRKVFSFKLFLNRTLHSIDFVAAIKFVWKVLPKVPIFAISMMVSLFTLLNVNHSPQSVCTEWPATTEVD